MPGEPKVDLGFQLKIFAPELFMALENFINPLIAVFKTLPDSYSDV